MLCSLIYEGKTNGRRVKQCEAWCLRTSLVELGEDSSKDSSNALSPRRSFFSQAPGGHRSEVLEWALRLSFVCPAC